MLVCRHLNLVNVIPWSFQCILASLCVVFMMYITSYLVYSILYLQRSIKSAASLIESASLISQPTFLTKLVSGVSEKSGLQITWRPLTNHGEYIILYMLSYSYNLEDESAMHDVLSQLTTSPSLSYCSNGTTV